MTSPAGPITFCSEHCPWFGRRRRKKKDRELSDPHTQRDINKPEKAQRRATRFEKGSFVRTSGMSTMRSFGLLPTLVAIGSDRSIGTNGDQWPPSHWSIRHRSVLMVAGGYQCLPLVTNCCLSCRRKISERTRCWQTCVGTLSLISRIKILTYHIRGISIYFIRSTLFTIVMWFARLVHSKMYKIDVMTYHGNSPIQAFQKYFCYRKYYYIASNDL